MPRRRVRLPRLRSVTTALVLLFGVLAMHALSGGPHSPRGGEHAMAAPGVLLTAGMPSMAEGAAALAAVLEPVSVPVVVGASVATVQGAAASWDARAAAGLPTQAPVAMAAMCVALLLGVVLLLGHRLLGRARAPRARQFSVRRLPRLDGLRRAPPPDLLALHCVLRT